MHTHVSGLAALYVFLMVVVVGTFWRVVAGLMARRGGFAGSLGKAMGAQF